MKNDESSHGAIRLFLAAETAADLMTKAPKTIRDDATIRAAASFLIVEEIGAAPVVDSAGVVVGVISHTDIVRHDSQTGPEPGQEISYYHDLRFGCPPALRELVQRMRSDVVRVRDLMSPVVMKVSTRDSALDVVAEFLALKIHRLFVVDEAARLVGVISALDVMRHLKKAE